MSSVTVLGHYPSYVDVADTLGASRFSVPAALWSRWIQTGTEWLENSEFLDDSVRDGRFIMTTPPTRAIPGTAFAREIAYLVSRGYPIAVSHSLSML